MKALIAALALFTAGVMAGDLVIVDGVEIPIPKGGETCEFHSIYCLFGYAPDGTFPGVAYKNAILAALGDNPVLPYPVCEGNDLSLGGGTGIMNKPCYQLVE